MKQSFKIILIVVLGVGALFYFAGKRYGYKPGEYYKEDKTNSNKVYQENSFYSDTKNSAKECDLPSLAQGAERLVTKVIDGDTVLIEGGYSVRLLGIDADERGHECYYPAQERLEELVLNKTAYFYQGKDNHDKYCRYLRYVFLGKENIGAVLVREGLAVARFGEGNDYEKEIQDAEEEARSEKKGCKWQGSQEGNVSSSKNFSWQRLTPELSGLEVIDACQARGFLGKEVIIEGEIADTYRSKKNNVFLNFAKPYPRQCFSGVIFSSSVSRFSSPPEKFFSGKTIRVRGTIQQYKNRPEIIIDSPQQVEVGSG